jgi:hypothetical protein
MNQASLKKTSGPEISRSQAGGHEELERIS